MPLNLNRPLTFIDLETTGLDLINDRIISIAMIKMLPNGSEERYKKLINPEMTIPQDSINIHGISNEMVTHQRNFKHHANEILDFLDDSDLAGYNLLRFDMPLLIESFARAGQEVDFSQRKLIDPLRIFRRKEPHSLAKALMFYCNKTHQAHDAEADADATREVLLGQLDFYNLSQSVDTLDGEFTPQRYHRYYDWQGNFYLNKDSQLCFVWGQYKDKVLDDILKEDRPYLEHMLKGNICQKAKQALENLLND